MAVTEIQTCRDCDNRAGLVPRYWKCTNFVLRDEYPIHLVGRGAAPDERVYCDFVRKHYEKGPTCSKFTPRRPWWKRLFGVK